MRKLKPKLLVPQHTRPVEGAEKIGEILTAYRDAIQLVHDQTVRYMNKGLHPTQVRNRTLRIANHKVADCRLKISIQIFWLTSDLPQIHGLLL